jgi:hypothetical protein
VTVPSDADKERAAELKREVLALRAKLNDPATPKIEKPRLRLQINTRIWMGQRLDPELFKTYLKR